MSDLPPDLSPGKAEGAESPFEAFVSEHFGRDTGPRFESPLASAGILLCFVNRSGSNYLAECLAASGHLPRAREVFLKANLIRHRREPGWGLSEVFEEIVTQHTFNQLFAAKLGYGQMRFFDSQGYLEAAFSRTKFIFLKRDDFLGQAVSLEIASQTGEWKSEHQGIPKESELEYDRKRIEQKLEGIRRKYDQFEAFFAGRGVTPLTVVYEELVNQPAETVRAAGEFLNCPIRLDPKIVKPAPATDPLKEAWKQRYLEGN